MNPKYEDRLLLLDLDGVLCAKDRLKSNEVKKMEIAYIKNNIKIYYHWSVNGS